MQISIANIPIKAKRGCINPIEQQSFLYLGVVEPNSVAREFILSGLVYYIQPQPQQAIYALKMNSRESDRSQLSTLPNSPSTLDFSNHNTHAIPDCVRESESDHVILSYRSLLHSPVSFPCVKTSQRGLHLTEPFFSRVPEYTIVRSAML